MAYSCDRCGAEQYACNCWELNAAKYVAGAAEAQDRHDAAVRRNQEWLRQNPPTRGRSGGRAARGRRGH